MFKLRPSLSPSGLRSIRHTRSLHSSSAVLNKKDLTTPNENKPIIPKAVANEIPANPSITLSNGLSNHAEFKSTERLSYQVPNTPPPPPNRSRWRKYAPFGALFLGGSWGLYTFSYLFTDSTPSEYLSQDYFTPFIITETLDIDKDHYLIELTPKFNKWKHSKPEIWNGSKLWSVEIKQPQIMVVRKYTPLPLQIQRNPQDDSKYIRVQNEQDYNDGKLVLYIKKYSQGEVARWIGRKDVGSELELRGPFIEFEFPSDLNTKVYSRPPLHNIPSKNPADPLREYKIIPQNIAFFAAGTGIAPILQSVLSRNSPLGHVTLYHSRRTDQEIKPFESLLFTLEKLGRVSIKSYVGQKKLTFKGIPSRSTNVPLLQDKVATYLNQQKSPYADAPSFTTALNQAQYHNKLGLEDPSRVIICGTDGYVRDLAGAKPYIGQGELGGWLKSKGWKQEDVFKM